MVLRIDDTDVERNTEASVNSIFEGLKWLGLNWDEEYKQSERLALHREMAQSIFAKGMAYRDLTPPREGDAEKSGAAQGTWLFHADMRNLSKEESDRRAALARAALGEEQPLVPRVLLHARVEAVGEPEQAQHPLVGFLVAVLGVVNVARQRERGQGGVVLRRHVPPSPPGRRSMMCGARRSAS